MIRTLLATFLLASFTIHAQKEHKLNFQEFLVDGIEANAAGTFSTSESNPVLKKMRIVPKSSFCELSNGEILIFYPNYEGVNVTLSDLKGNIIEKTEMNQAEYAFSNLTKGEYLLSTVSSDGVKSIDLVNINNKILVPGGIVSDESNRFSSGSTVTFSVEPIAGVETVWNMGDGTIIQDKTEINHTYQKGGKYIISVEASSFDCEMTIKHEVEIYDLADSLQSDY
jgi:hypothetical protein